MSIIYFCHIFFAWNAKQKEVSLQSGECRRSRLLQKSICWAFLTLPNSLTLQFLSNQDRVGKVTNNPILKHVWRQSLANSQIPEQRIAETSAPQLLQTLWQDTKAAISPCWFSPCHCWIRLVWGIARRMLSSFPQNNGCKDSENGGNNTLIHLSTIYLNSNIFTHSFYCDFREASVSERLTAFDLQLQVKSSALS